jgi:hypothetical protein
VGYWSPATALSYSDRYADFSSGKIGAAHARFKTLRPGYFGLRMCKGFDRPRARSSPRLGAASGCYGGRLRLSRGRRAKPQDHPRSNLHQPRAPPATPQGCHGQSTSPHPRRCGRGIKLGERRTQGVEARGVGKPVFFGRFRPASGPRQLQRPPPPAFPVLFCA